VSIERKGQGRIYIENEMQAGEEVAQLIAKQMVAGHPFLGRVIQNVALTNDGSSGKLTEIELILDDGTTVKITGPDMYMEINR